MTEFVFIEVEQNAVGERIDRVLAQKLQRSRNQVQTWLEKDQVLVHGRPVSASYKLRAEDAIAVAQSAIEPELPNVLAAEPWPESIAVLEETENFLVLDKPADLVVHPGAGRSSGTLANALVGRWPEIAGIGHPQRPGIVHRLDAGTTGVMTVARSELGYQALSRGFAERRIDKLYLAVAYGWVRRALEIDLPIGRHPKDRRRMTIRKNGRAATSTVTPLAYSSTSGTSLVMVRLHTGRTHQIRVHLKAAKHPLIGDPTYGEALWKSRPKDYQPVLRDFARPALHSWRLAFPDPSDDQLRRYVAPLPQDLDQLWRALDPNAPESMENLLGQPALTPED